MCQLLRSCYHDHWELPTKSWEEKKFESRQKNAPRPLPAKRKRRLSAPSPKRNSQSFRALRPAQKTLWQTDSPLFKLPVELRQQIWEEAIGKKVFHIKQEKKTLLHFVCDECRHTDYTAGWPRYPDGHTFIITCQEGCRRPPLYTLALLKTCRRIYFETIDLVYSLNTFAFHDLYPVSWFASTILPSRLQSIRSLRIYWDIDLQLHGDFQVLCRYQAKWSSLCALFASMKGLRDLRIKFTGTVGPYYSLPLRGYYSLEPLRKIQHVPVFQVYVPLLPAAGSLDASMPFELIQTGSRK